MRGSERNLKCPCGSGKKWKKCCTNLNKSEEVLNNNPSLESEAVPDEVIDYFTRINRDSEFLKKLGIYQSHQGSISRIKEGYLLSLENGIYKINTDEALNFYEIIGVIAMETLGNNWIENEGKKVAKDRSEIYQIISILGATDTFKRIISYTGEKIGTSSIPNSGFTKNFLTLSFDIFCLRHRGFLPKRLIERLKKFDQYQGARYEIAVAAIFCRLGYDLKWFDDKNTKQKHPEFIASKEGKEIYVEVKSRHIAGVHNTIGFFNETKALKSTGWIKLVNEALKKQIPPKAPFIIFIDMNAIDDKNNPPNWLGDVGTKIVKQNIDKYLEKGTQFTSIIFTNYSYHYQGLNYADEGTCATYENNTIKRPYFSIQEKIDIQNAIKHYGFIPDYHIPGQMTILQSSSEYPTINNIPNFF